MSVRQCCGIIGVIYALSGTGSIPDFAQWFRIMHALPLILSLNSVTVRRILIFRTCLVPVMKITLPAKQK